MWLGNLGTRANHVSRKLLAFSCHSVLVMPQTFIMERPLKRISNGEIILIPLRGKYCEIISLNPINSLSESLLVYNDSGISMKYRRVLFKSPYDEKLYLEKHFGSRLNDNFEWKETPENGCLDSFRLLRSFIRTNRGACRLNYWSSRQITLVGCSSAYLRLCLTSKSPQFTCIRPQHPLPGRVSCDQPKPDC
jgi:hypothetical protein